MVSVTIEVHSLTSQNGNSNPQIIICHWETTLHCRLTISNIKLEIKAAKPLLSLVSQLGYVQHPERWHLQAYQHSSISTAKFTICLPIIESDFIIIMNTMMLGALNLHSNMITPFPEAHVPFILDLKYALHVW